MDYTEEENNPTTAITDTASSPESAAFQASQIHLVRRRCLQFEEAQHNVVANDPGSWNPTYTATYLRPPFNPANSEVLDSSCADISSTPCVVQLGNQNSEQAKRVYESDITKPQKKRMTTNSTVDGRKRCNCKKSKCLKLYCDCFAAGLYCDEACSCQECFNRPDYEDTVIETREQIELRSPLAFSPKIHCLEDGDQLMPIAGKHKKGCNCKKSMCLKKYCECYQANVGCSGECRCEGCKNVYGKKGEYNMYNESGSMRAIHQKLNDPDKKQLESIRLGFSLPEFHNPHNLTPWTPFQHSDHGKDTSTTCQFTGRYIPSPGSANCDMISDINANHPTSVTNLPPMMDWPNSTRTSGNFSSLSSLSSHGSPGTPVSLFAGPKLNDSNEKPS